jgi:GWxTD domain-containing protein
MMNVQLCKIIIIFLSCSILQLISPAVFANETRVDSLLFRGDSLYEIGNLDKARIYYKKALEIERDSKRVLAGLGKIAVYHRNWGDAKGFFGDILKLEEDNLEAHYYRGICYRETGVYKALIFRDMDWNKSERHFEKLLSLDSAYQDVLYQYAQLARYRRQYEKAVELGQAQIRLRPDLSEPSVKIFRLYRYLIANRNLDKSVNWLSEQPWEYAHYFIGEKFRREMMFYKADSVFQAFMKNNSAIPIQPILLSLARLHYERGDLTQGQKYFWQAVDLISNIVEADLVFEDVKYVVTDEELDLYQSLSIVDKKKDFFYALWIERDPTPAAAINIRLAEHYRRLIYAEKYYEWDGFRTWFEDPDTLNYLDYPENNKLNQEFNDKGLIYLRHGEPDDIIKTAGEFVPFNESWLYYQQGEQPRLTFHFMLGKSGNDWRFAPVITHPAILEDRLTWDNIYYRMLHASEIDRLSYENEMAELSRESVSIGLSTDRHSWDEGSKSFLIPFTLETFRGEDGQTVLELSYALPTSEIAAEISEKQPEIEVERGLAVYNNEYKEISKSNEQITLSLQNRDDFIGYHRFVLSPGRYSLAMHALPQDTKLIGGWKVTEILEDYSLPDLKMSDIQLASRVEFTTGQAEFEKNGIAFYPNPGRIYYRKIPIHVYFEIYNLKMDEKGITFFSIDYDLTSLNFKKGLTNLFGILGGGSKSSVTIHTERQGSDEFSPEYLAIDAGNLNVGEYELTIKISDQNANKVVEQKTRLILE